MPNEPLALAIRAAGRAQRGRLSDALRRAFGKARAAAPSWPNMPGATATPTPRSLLAAIGRIEARLRADASAVQRLRDDLRMLLIAIRLARPEIDAADAGRAGGQADASCSICSSAASTPWPR